MSAKIKKTSLPGIPGSNWHICQYTELNEAPSIGDKPIYPGTFATFGNDLYISGYFGEHTGTLAWTLLSTTEKNSDDYSAGVMKTWYSPGTSGSRGELMMTPPSGASSITPPTIPAGKMMEYDAAISGVNAGSFSQVQNLIKALIFSRATSGTRTSFAFSGTSSTYEDAWSKLFTGIDDGTFNGLGFTLFVNASAFGAEKGTCWKVVYGREMAPNTNTTGYKYVDMYYALNTQRALNIILRFYDSSPNDIRLGFEYTTCAAGEDGKEWADDYSTLSKYITPQNFEFINYGGSIGQAFHKFVSKHPEDHYHYNYVITQINLPQVPKTPVSFWFCSPLYQTSTYDATQSYKHVSCKRFMRLNLYEERTNCSNAQITVMTPCFDEIVRVSPDLKYSLVEYVIPFNSSGGGQVSDRNWMTALITPNPLPYIDTVATMPSTIVYNNSIYSATITTTTTSQEATPTIAPTTYNVICYNQYRELMTDSDQCQECTVSVYDTKGKLIKSAHPKTNGVATITLPTGTQVPSNIVAEYKLFEPQTISGLETGTHTFSVYFDEGYERVTGSSYHLIPHVTYLGDPIQTYAIGQYSDWDWSDSQHDIYGEYPLTSTESIVYDYDNVSFTNGIDSFVVENGRPNQLFIFFRGASPYGAGESYGPIEIPSQYGDRVLEFDIELEGQLSFAPNIPN